MSPIPVLNTYFLLKHLAVFIYRLMPLYTYIDTRTLPPNADMSTSLVAFVIFLLQNIKVYVRIVLYFVKKYI